MKNQQKVKQKDAVKMLKLISEGNYQFQQDWSKNYQYQTIQRKTKPFQISVLKYRNNSETKILTQSHLKSQQKKSFFRKRIHRNFSKKTTIKFISTKCQKPIKVNLTRQNQSLQRSDRNLNSSKHNILSLGLINENYMKQQTDKNNGFFKQQIQSQLRTQGSQSYVIKVGKISNKKIMKQPQDKLNHYINNFKQQKSKQKLNAVSQLIKNKIKTKNSKNFIFRKDSNDVISPQQQKPIWKQSIVKQSIVKQSIVQTGEKTQFVKFNLSYQESPQAKLLKNWLDTNRFKKKRSIASLLKQHLYKKSQQKSCQRQNNKKTSVIKSARLISLTAHRHQIIRQNL